MIRNEYFPEKQNFLGLKNKKKPINLQAERRDTE